MRIPLERYGLMIWRTNAPMKLVVKDEMNLHVPQGYKCMAEMAEIMSVKENMIDPSNSIPIPKIYFDALATGYMITKKETFLPRELFFNILCSIFNGFDFNEKLCSINLYERERGNTLDFDLDDEKAEFDKIIYTGHDLFSMLLPKNFTYRMKGVEIEKGIFKSGILSDKCLGQNPNSIISYLDNYFSNDTSVKFVNNYQMAMNMVVTELGLSAGLEDCLVVTKDELEPKIISKIEKANLMTNVSKIAETLDSAFNIAFEINTRETCGKENLRSD